MFTNNRYKKAYNIEGLSDHKIQLINTQTQHKDTRKKQRERRVHSRRALKEFGSAIEKENWQETEMEINPENACQVFLDIFLGYFNTFFSCKNRRNHRKENQNNGWATRGIRIPCKTKKSLYRQLKYEFIPKTCYGNCCKILKL